MDDIAAEDDGDRKPAAVFEKSFVTSSPQDGNMTEVVVKVKPALKKDSINNRKRVSDKSQDDKKHLKWDEQAIEEHDLLRGTRMKIDEPNTPFTQYDSGADSDDSRRPKSPANQKQHTLSWDTLQTRLDSVAAVRAQHESPASSHAGDGTDQSDAEEERRKEMRRLEFEEHRARHYNEFEQVRRFRQENPVLVDDEDNDDEEYDEGDEGDDEAGNASE